MRRSAGRAPSLPWILLALTGCASSRLHAPSRAPGAAVMDLSQAVYSDSSRAGLLQFKLGEPEPGPNFEMELIGRGHIEKGSELFQKIHEARDWLLDYYRQRELLAPVVAAKMVEQFFNGPEQLGTPGDATLIFRDPLVPHKVIALSRVVAPTSLDELTPAEKRLLGRGLEKPVARNELRVESYLVPRVRDLQLTMEHEERPAYVHGFYEIKNVANSVPLLQQVIPYSFALLDHLGATYRGDLHVYRSLLPPEIHPAEAPPSSAIFPQGYLVETDQPALVATLLRKGFTVVWEGANPDIPGNRTTLLAGSREAAVHGWLHSMRRRIGEARLKRTRLAPSRKHEK